MPEGRGNYTKGKGGLFTGSTGGGGDWPAPDTSAAGIADATSAWSGVHFADIREYQRTGHVRDGFSETDDPIHGISNERAAKSTSTLTALVATGPTAPPLSRGMNVDDATYARLSSVKPGTRVDMSLSSWSADNGKATEFAKRPQWTGDDETGHYTSHPVVLRTEGAKGFDMQPHSHYPQEKEWLTDGRFSVVSASREGDFLVVSLRQDGVFADAAAMEGLP